MRLRQVALAAHDLDPVLESLHAVLGLEVGFRDPAVKTFGLRNAVLPVGDGFLELLSPIAPDAPVARFLARRGGDGGYMVIVQTPALAADRRRLEGLGVRVVWELALPDVATIHLHPRDVGGALLSLDEARPPEGWPWAGPEWRAHVRTDVVQALVGAELSSPDPARLAARWAELLARPARPAADGALEIGLDTSRLRFVPAAGEEALRAIELHARDAGARERALQAARARGLPVEGDAFAVAGSWVRLA